MIGVTDLRAGTTFETEDNQYQVIKYTHIKMGRGSATVRVTARNLKTGGIEEKTFVSGAKVEPLQTGKRKLQYLYKDEENAVFVDAKTYEQIEIPKIVLGDKAPYLTANQSLDVLFVEDKPVSVDFPVSVALRVIEADPGVRGNSATNLYKDALLENEFKAKVPLFVNRGDLVRIDTRTGEYKSKIKNQNSNLKNTNKKYI